METHVIIWSGGADSTYLVNMLGKESSSSYPIYVIGVSHCMTYDKKRKAEHRAREKLLKVFKQKGFHIKYKEITVDTDIEWVHNAEPTLWLTSIFTALPYETDIHVHFGYVYGDSFWHAKTEFVTAFDAITKVRTVGSNINITCKFDLEWTHKIDIIKSLIKDDLFKYTWTCEHPKKVTKECGECETCLEKNKILKELKK